MGGRASELAIWNAEFMLFVNFYMVIMNYGELRLTEATTAKTIAGDALRSNVVSLFDQGRVSSEKKYLLAGARQYRTLWARDMAMSVQGAMAAGEFQAVKNSLEIFFKFQRFDGLLPRLIDNQNILTRVLMGVMGHPPMFREPLRAWFTTENRVIAIDSNLAIVWASSRYILRSEDLVFAKAHFVAAEKAILFIETHFSVEGIVGKQPPFADWADSVQRTGRVAFTNELYILALRGLSQWAEKVGEPVRASFYQDKAAEVTERFLTFFWDPKERIIVNFERDHRWTADANFFAVAHGILPREKSIELMDRLRMSPLWIPFPGRPTWPDYEPHMKSWLVKRVNLAGYHDQYLWFWLTCLAACAETAIGNADGYAQIMRSVSGRIVADRTVHEVYEYDERNQQIVPVKRWLYRAESPFTWSAAMFLEACEDGCR